MEDLIQSALGTTIEKVNFDNGKPTHHGKVRDSFILDAERRAIVVSDRVSSFDFILGTIPFKGQVLNQITSWWFHELNKISIPNHFIESPDPNISVVKNATPLPVEIIVRGYLTGTTTTSSWYAYQHCDRMISGIEMPEGMVKNQKFETPIITPTTKPETGHDEKISRDEIIDRGLVDAEIYEKAEDFALKMFAHGQKIASERNLILVDTKYEMGIDSNGNLIVIDEVHTPDSSRYWVADSYESRMADGQEPEGLDKEFVRRMIVDKGYDVDSDEDPAHYMDDKIRTEAAKKYIELYELMTGVKFQFPANVNTEERIIKSLKTL